MDYHALNQLNYYLDQRNKDVINKLKTQLALLLNEHEEEFFDAVLGEHRELFTKALSVFQDLFYEYKNYTLYLYYAPNTYISIDYPPKNFFIPIPGIKIGHERLCRFSKYPEIKAQCDTIDYFAQRLQELKSFISLNDRDYSLLQFLRTYPELYNYVNKYFRFKTKPLHKNPKKLPEHLSEYIRRIEFMSQL
jgi:hypothetical protein